MQVVEDRLPAPGSGEVRLRMLAAGVSFGDVLNRVGAIPGHQKPPFTPGYDVVGVVDAVGSGVSLVEGRMMAALLSAGGGYGEYVCVPENRLVGVPAGVDPVRAAAVALNYFIAYQMLHRVAAVEPGGRILVHGAAGGVGTAFLQLAGLAGIQAYGTASASKHQLVRDLGAVPIDYRNDDFVARLRDRSGGAVHAVFDPIGGTNYVRSFRVLRRGGTLVAFGASKALRNGRGSKLVSVTSVLGLGLLKITPGGRRTVFYTADSLQKKQPASYREDLAAVLGLLADKKISPVITEEIPLGEVARAHALLEHRSVTGKVVLTAERTGAEPPRPPYSAGGRPTRRALSSHSRSHREVSVVWGAVATSLRLTKNRPVTPSTSGEVASQAGVSAPVCGPGVKGLRTEATRLCTPRVLPPRRVPLMMPGCAPLTVIRVSRSRRARP